MSFLGHKHGHGLRLTDSQHGKEARNTDRDNIHGARTSGMVHFHGDFKQRSNSPRVASWMGQNSTQYGSTTIIFQRNQCRIPTPFEPNVMSINVFHLRRNVHKHTSFIQEETSTNIRRSFVNKFIHHFVFQKSIVARDCMGKCHLTLHTRQ